MWPIQILGCARGWKRGTAAAAHDGHSARGGEERRAAPAPSPAARPPTQSILDPIERTRAVGPEGEAEAGRVAREPALRASPRARAV